MKHSLNQQTALATIITPIVHTLPESILRRIFDFSIQGSVVLPPPRENQRRVLTQVCQEWRRIILLTPDYWNSFDFEWTVQPPSELFFLAEYFFGVPEDTTPLSISFGRSLLQSDVGRNILESVIRPRAHRVRFFSCSITKETLTTFFERDPVHLPVLEAIDVAVICDLNGTIASRLPVRGSIDLSAFHRAPHLRDAKLHILGGVHSADLKLPWGQLTRLDLGHTCVHVHTFIHIMEESALLEDGVFCVSFTRYYDGQPTRLRRISIPLLRSLRLRLLQPSQDARIFGSLYIPLLEVLWVERDEPGQAIRDMTIYETLLAGVNANIKCLTIAEYTIPMARQWFIPWLNRSPRMTYQRLDGVLRSCNSLTALFFCPGIFIHPLVIEKIASGEFLPLLEQLGVNSVRGWDIIWMVQRKNFASTFPDSGPSSSPVVRSLRPVALTYLRLFTMGCGLSAADVQKLEDAAMALDLARGYTMRHIDIANGRNLI